MAALLVAGFLAGATAASATARAADDLSLPPWGRSELPRWARSLRVIGGEQPIYPAANAKSGRRGTARKGALLPLYAARNQPGCTGLWLQVGPSAWMCQRDVELSHAPALAPEHAARQAPPDGLPYRYYFASRDGSFGYRSLEEVDVGEPIMQLEPGFAVAIIEERMLAGQPYGLTNQGVWVPMRDFGRARAFMFRGAEISQRPDDGVLPLAWVVVDRARLYTRRQHLFLPTQERRERFERVDWLEAVKTFSGTYLRIDDSHWMRASDLAHPTLAPVPSDVAVDRGERWIDIELESQTLVAYEGHRPVFATIVSTGKGKTEGHPFETPKGSYRIWVKLLTSVMDNLEDENAGRYYRIEDVPYVQYFSKGVGLHAAFWHRSFGHVRSHGCVNLAPLDAQRLFWWTGPHLPAGWSAALPTRYDRGTLVRVR